MAQTTTALDFKIHEMARRIRELREIENLSIAEMASKTDVSEAEYAACDPVTGWYPLELAEVDRLEKSLY